MAEKEGTPHLDESGRARMVDVGGKAITRRRAVAEGTVRLGETAYRRLIEGTLGKGEALAVARLAGIQAAKRTPDWIPLCHTVPLSGIQIAFEAQDDTHEVTVTAEATADWTTGVEMEALVAVSASLLSIYDMVKGIERGVEIHDIRLLEKEGGRSGHWVREGTDLHRGAEDRK